MGLVDRSDATGCSWARIRVLAARALALMGEPLQRPVFPGSTWVGKSADGEVVQIRGDDVPVKEDSVPKRPDLN